MKITKYLKLRYFKLKYFKILLTNFYNKKKNKIILGYLKNKYANTIFIKQAQINNFNILVFLNNGIGRQIYGLKKYEKENTEFFKKLIKKNWVSLDIGANMGYYTLLLATLSKNGKIYAFEPNRLEYNTLNLNISLNNFKNIISANIALSNKNGYETFNITQDSGFSSFRDTQREKVNEVVRVKTKTLDFYVTKNNIKKIDFIKIDIEGSEKMMLQGTVKTLAIIKPKIMMIEICEENLRPYKENGKTIINFLKKFNYKPYTLKNNKLEQFNKEKYGKSMDMYFVHKNYIENIL